MRFLCPTRNFFSMGSERWTKVSFERQQCCSHHAHDAMQSLWGPLIAATFCPNPPPIGIPNLACGLGYSTLRRKIPHVRLVPLNVGWKAKKLGKRTQENVLLEL